jgi:hypothetical protein
LRKEKAKKGGGKAKSGAFEFLAREEKELEEKFHEFLDMWKHHIREEIAIHEAMLSGKHSFRRHLADTARIHEEFLKKIKKLC